LEDLIVVFAGSPPSRKRVLEQHFSFKPGWWKGRVPARWWPSRLESLDLDPDRNEYRVISRADVFEMASSSDSVRASTGALVAAYVWGMGNAGFLVGRYARVFARNPESEVERKLESAIEVLRTDGAVAAYGVLARGGESYVRYLGASFYTKFLYFRGWDRTPGGLQPLILDRYVTIGLNDCMGWSWRERGPWSAAQYSEYLDFAGGFDRWSPDAVEQRLFRRGQEIGRERGPR
jgi:hypothetical protein